MRNKGDYLIEVMESKGSYYVRIKFGNGKIFMHSEKYKRRMHAIAMAMELHARLGMIDQIKIKA